jgi:hypothetical protein
MGFAAAPAATTAFGSTAFWAGTAAAAPVASSVVMPSIFTTAATSGGGLLSSFSLSKLLPTLNQAAPYLYWGSQALGVGGRLSEGGYQSRMFELRNLELQADLSMKRLNSEIESVERFKKLKRVMANNVARQYAGGVSGLDGSAKLYDTIAQQEYGKDYAVAMLNIENELLKGNVQSNIYDMTAQQVVNNTYLDSAVQLGTAAYNYKRLGFPSGGADNG